MVKERFSSLIIKILLLLFALCVENGVELQRTDVELFSSLEELSHLAATQKEAVNYMRNYLDQDNDTYNEANKLIAEFEHLAELAYSNPKEFVSNPINSFLLIKYYYHDLQSFLSKFKFTETPEYIESLIRSKINLPNEEDYKGAVRALLRLQDTYLLSPLEMSKGVFWHSKSFRPLNAFECYEIGRMAQNNSDYKHAINWFREALNKTDNSTIDKISCVESIAYSLLNLGEVKEAINIVKEGLNEEPDNVYLLVALETFQKAIIEAVSSNIDWIIESETVSLKDLFKDVAATNEHLYSYDRTFYTALCRGDEEKVVRKALSCRYITYNPLLRIAPVKEEQVFDDPPIWVYHDVLTRNQADKMIDLVRSSLNRARVATPGTDGTVDDVRISKLNWVDDSYDPILPGITKLTSAITNLTMRNEDEAEQWQINNYGLGGLYEPHFDNIARPKDLTEYEKQSGLRIATWMFYIEAPEVGGATVFPEIGARVNSTSRSAVFWYNVLPSGEIDRRSIHAGCPVFIGSKWVSNKWIRSNAQMFRHKCNLFEDQIHPRHYPPTDPWFY